MIKIASTGFAPSYKPNKDSFINLIRGFVELEEVTEINDADFLLCSVLTDDHWFVSDNCIKILYTGENITPNFMACDYAIGFDYITYGDRYLRFPLYYFYEDINEKMETKHLNINKEECKKVKTDFCSITVSNTKRNPIFKLLFDELSTYKRVDSGGKWENNVGGAVSDKFSFDVKHKFSIVCENSSSPGYTTEKLIEAFAAQCIPIYWGDPEVGKVFNKKAFINVLDFSSIKDVVELVKKIDEDDELFFSYLCQPALVNPCYNKKNQMIKLSSFLYDIFSQEICSARRRNRDCLGAIYIERERARIRSYYQVYKFKVFLYKFFSLKWIRRFKGE